MVQLLQDNNQYLIAKQIIEACTTLIGNCYSSITSLNSDKDIAKVQDLIERVSDLKLGFWGLKTIYERNLKESEVEEKYYVQQGVTLPEIASAFYGKQEFWQYIYSYNGLTTDELQVGQELLIPTLPDIPEVVLYQSEILVADLTNFFAIVDGFITGE